MMPPYEPTSESREKVKSYAAVGIPQDDIARVLGIDPKTLRKYYRDELDTAATMANAAIGGALYNKAKGGDTTAMIWWTKTRMKWSEQHKVDMTLSDSDDKIEQMRKARERVASGVMVADPSNGPVLPNILNAEDGEVPD